MSDPMSCDMSCHSTPISPLIPDGCFLFGHLWCRVPSVQGVQCAGCPWCRVSTVQCVHVQVAHGTGFASGLCRPPEAASSLASCRSREGVTNHSVPLPAWRH